MSRNNKTAIQSKLFKLNVLGLAVATALPVCVAAEGESKAAERSIEKITVTATRKVENLQNVPIAVSALSADELDKLQIKDLGDLQANVPNLSLHSGDASNAVIYIRGVGQIDSISFNDPGVGVYLDDVYLGRVQGAFLDVIDPQQIEVLRGPQGTLYGRNTIGGAVKFTSALPTNESQGYVDLHLGNYNAIGGKASISGALVDDQLFGRFSVAKQTRDGFTKNLYNNKDDNDKDSFAWRGSLLFQPNEEFSASLVLDGSKSTPSASRTPHRETPIYSLARGAYVPPLDNPFTVDVTYNDLERLETKGAALTLSYTSGASTFKSITSRREMEYRTHLDLDATVDQSFGIYNFEEQDQFSQELQWLYDSENWSLVSGLYYFDENDWSFGGAVAPEFFVPWQDFMLPFPYMSALERISDNTSKAAYLNLTFELSDKLAMTLGARYTKEQKDVVNQNELFDTSLASAEQMEQAFNTGAAWLVETYDATNSWNSFTPKVVFDYQYNDDTMFYISASEGFKSGGFNGRSTNAALSFDPETLWSYEVGSKSTLNNSSIRLNTAFFYNDYKNFQLSRFSIDPDSGAFLSLFENAGKVTMYGAELELEAVVTDNLDLSFNLGYLGGGYDEFIGDFEQDVSDERELVNAPKWSSRLGLEYFMDLSNGSELSLRTSLSFRSKTYLTASSSEVLAQSSYALWDIALMWSSAQEDWTVSLYGKNLTDKHYREHGFDLSASPGVQLGYYGAPRTFGLNVKYRF